MFQDAFRDELEKIKDPMMFKSMPKSLCYQINKRMVVDGLDPSEHQGYRMKCAVCDVYIWNDPFVRTFGLLLPSHPGLARTSSPRLSQPRNEKSQSNPPRGTPKLLERDVHSKMM